MKPLYSAHLAQLLAHPFFRNADRTTPCWTWTGDLGEHGVGISGALTFGKYAPDIAYRLVRGPIPTGMHAIPRCGTRSCVEPFHLRLVEADVHAAFLAAPRPAPTTKPPARTLDDGERAALIARYRLGNVSKSALAREYGVQPARVAAILATDPESTRVVRHAYRPKLDADKVREIRRLSVAGTSLSKIAKLMGIGAFTVYSVVKRRTWKHVE